MHPNAPASTASKATKAWFGGPNVRGNMFAGRPTRVGQGAPIAGQVSALQGVRGGLRSIGAGADRTMPMQYPALAGMRQWQSTEALKKVRGGLTPLPGMMAPMPGMPMPMPAMTTPGMRQLSSMPANDPMRVALRSQAGHTVSPTQRAASKLSAMRRRGQTVTGDPTSAIMRSGERLTTRASTGAQADITKRALARSADFDKSRAGDFNKNVKQPLKSFGASVSSTADKINKSRLGVGIQNLSNKVAQSARTMGGAAIGAQAPMATGLGAMQRQRSTLGRGMSAVGGFGSRIAGGFGAVGGRVADVGRRAGGAVMGSRAGGFLRGAGQVGGFGARMAGRGVAGAGRGIASRFGGMGSGMGRMMPGMGSMVAGMALTAISGPLEETVSKSAGKGLGKGLGEAARGAGMGAMLGGPIGAIVGAAVGAGFGFAIGKYEEQFDEATKKANDLKKIGESLQLVKQARRMIKPTAEIERLRVIEASGEATQEQLDKLTAIENKDPGVAKAKALFKWMNAQVKDGDRLTGQQKQRLEELKAELTTRQQVAKEAKNDAERAAAAVDAAKRRAKILKDIERIGLQIAEGEADAAYQVTLRKAMESKYAKLKQLGFETVGKMAEVEQERLVVLERILRIQEEDNNLAKQRSVIQQGMMAGVGGRSAIGATLKFDKGEFKRQIESLTIQKGLLDSTTAESSEEAKRLQASSKKTAKQIEDAKHNMLAAEMKAQMDMVEWSKDKTLDQIQAWEEAASNAAGAFENVIGAQERLASVFATIGSALVKKISDMSGKQLQLLETSGASVERRLTEIRRGAAQQLAAIQHGAGRQLGTVGPGVGGTAGLGQMIGALSKAIKVAGVKANQTVVDEETGLIRFKLANERQAAAELRSDVELRVRSTQREIEIRKVALQQQIGALQTRMQQENQLYAQRRNQQAEFGRLLLESPDKFKEAIKNMNLAKAFVSGIKGVGKEGLGQLGGRIKRVREQGGSQVLLRVLQGMQSQDRFGGPELVSGVGNKELLQLFSQLQIFSPEKIGKQREKEAARIAEIQKQIKEKQDRIIAIDEFDANIQQQLLKVASLDAQIAMQQRTDIIKALQGSRAQLTTDMDKLKTGIDALNRARLTTAAYGKILGPEGRVKGSEKVWEALKGFRHKQWDVRGQLQQDFRDSGYKRDPERDEKRKASYKKEMETVAGIQKMMKDIRNKTATKETIDYVQGIISSGTIGDLPAVDPKKEKLKGSTDKLAGSMDEATPKLKEFARVLGEITGMGKRPSGIGALTAPGGMGGGQFKQGMGGVLSRLQKTVRPTIGGGGVRLIDPRIKELERKISDSGGTREQRNLLRRLKRQSLKVHGGGKRGQGRAIYKHLMAQEGGKEAVESSFRGLLQQRGGRDTSFVKDLKGVRGEGKRGRRHINVERTRQLLGSQGFGDVARGIKTKGQAADAVDKFLKLSEQLSNNTTKVSEDAARNMQRILTEGFAESIGRLNEGISRGQDTNKQIIEKIDSITKNFDLFTPEAMERLNTTIREAWKEANDITFKDISNWGTVFGEKINAELEGSKIFIDVPKMKHDIEISVGNAISGDEFARQLTEQLAKHFDDKATVEMIRQQIMKIAAPLIKAGMISPGDFPNTGGNGGG